VTVSFSIENPDQWQRVINDTSLPLRAEPIKDFLDGEVAEHLMERASARFRNQGAETSGWAPLAKMTVELRGSSQPILDHTGKMRAWLTGGTTPRSKRDDEGYTLHFPGKGTSEMEEKFAAAQKGARFPPTPARPVAFLSAGDDDIITALFRDMVQDHWTASGVQ